MFSRAPFSPISVPAPRLDRAQLAHVCGGNRDAAGRGRQPRAREVEEDALPRPFVRWEKFWSRTKVRS